MLRNVQNVKDRKLAQEKAQSQVMRGGFNATQQTQGLICNRITNQDDRVNRELYGDIK